MKHRSVIAFVIVAAALFSLPQLSHDLQALKGAVGARLHRELLQAFLCLPVGEPAAVVPAARPAEPLLASCPQEALGAKAAKSGRATASGRVEGRGGDKGFEQSAMIGDPVSDPINQTARAEVKGAADRMIKSPDEVKVETEIAMIVPPESGLDPRGVARALASSDTTRVEAEKFRVEAEGLRVATAAAFRFEAKGPEWQRAVEDAARKLNASAPGVYEFRVVRDGAKLKALKLKCSECPATAPRLPRGPRPVAVDLSVPAPPAPAEWASE